MFVRIYQSILTYVLLFLAIFLLLKFLGLIYLSSGEIIGYALIFYGISIVYLSLGRNQKYSLFFGTVFFLTGILLYVLNNFLVFSSTSALLPSALLIPGIAYLMLFMDNPSNKKFLVIGTALIAVGLTTITINGQLNLPSFYHSVLKITTSYWQIVLVVVVILILISIEEKK